jgi:hypothetical protein
LIAYFDTSAIVPLLVDEPSSGRANLFWSEAERIVTSRLLYAESRSALAMANRIGWISGSALHEAVKVLEQLYEQMDLVETSDTIVRRAGSLAETHALRGYDAVHLASAETLAGADGVLVAGDGPLCLAATALGLAVGRLT